MKWITATDLKHWADQRESQGLLPELISRLIHASISDFSKFRFPSGDTVYLPGLDGILESHERVYNIEPGLSLWECGTNKDTKSKAESDYKKRVSDSLGYDKKSAVFVFVTLRLWEGAETWAVEKQKVHDWKNVIVLTAVELEDWLSLCPAVALWLAEILHKKALTGAQDVNTFWHKWSVSKTITLQPEILLGGRNKEQEELNELFLKPSIAFVQSMAQEESMAFSVACILKHSNLANLQSRCIVVKNEETLETLLNEYDNLIIIAKVKNKNHSYATEKGHSMIYATSISEVPKAKNQISLPLIDRDKFISSLIASNLEREYAEQLSRETVRNITILKRRLGMDYTTPEWAQPENINELIPAILVGRWTDDKEGDKEIVSSIAGETYDSYSRKLQKWAYHNDSPLVNVGGKWRIFSPYETFLYAANYITSSDFEKYKEAIIKITNDLDPDASEKLSSTSLHFWNNKQGLSGWIKEGLFQSAILISLISESQILHTPLKGNLWIDRMIREILNHSTIEWWFSNRYVLSKIAEASPDSYVEFIRNDINKEESIIKKLFIPKGVDSLFNSGENYIQILQTLKMLLWEEKYLLPISYILAELSSIKNDINSLDKPIISLASTYTIWHPQTYANTENRNQALEALINKYPLQGFEVCARLLDDLDHSISFDTHPMRWRCFGQNRPTIINSDIWLSIDRICNLLITHCNNSEGQICKILKIASQLDLGQKNRIVLFNYVKDNVSNYLKKDEIITVVRRTYNHHKIYHNPKWSLDENELKQWEKLLFTLEPTDPFERYQWMFKKPYLEFLEIGIKRTDYQSGLYKILDIRSKSLLKIYEKYGIRKIYDFANIVGNPYSVGEAYACISKLNDFESILRVVAKCNSDSIIQFSRGFFTRYAIDIGTEQFLLSIDSIKDKYLNIIYLPLISVYPSRVVWSYVDKLPEKIRNQYWENEINRTCRDLTDDLYLIQQFNRVKRYDESLEIIFNHIQNDDLPTALILNTIIELSSNLKVGFLSDELVDIIYVLDKRVDVDVEKLIKIEFFFFNWLKNQAKTDNLKLLDEIMSNPESMMDLLNMLYFSSDTEECKSEFNDSNRFCFEVAYKILSKTRRIPFVNQDNKIDEAGLNGYIDELRTLGIKDDKIEKVDCTIGELLANYPEIDDYPPKPICEIIEKLNNSNLNNGFRNRIFNKLGMTSRSIFEGGTIEKSNSHRFKKIADSKRFSYPVVAEIFDKLSLEYGEDANSQDESAMIQQMDY